MILKQYQLLITAAAAWLTAQVLKTLIYMIVNKEFRPERFLGNGGMPSSHSATVCSFTTVCLIRYGAASFEFAISFLFTAVVLADAMGVRLETGKQAKLLNAIVEENFLMLRNIDPDKRLKELIGHTPFQVLIGALLGIGVALLLNSFCRG